MITTPELSPFATLPASDLVREVHSSLPDRMIELHVSRHGHDIVSRINVSHLDRVTSLRRVPRVERVERRVRTMAPPHGERRAALLRAAGAAGA